MKKYHLLNVNGRMTTLKESHYAR